MTKKTVDPAVERLRDLLEVMKSEEVEEAAASGDPAACEEAFTAILNAISPYDYARLWNCVDDTCSPGAARLSYQDLADRVSESKCTRPVCSSCGSEQTYNGDENNDL